MPMSSRSIRFRLVTTALLAIICAMTIAVYTLTMLFEHHVERRVVAALEADLRQLMAGLTVAESASVSLQRRPADPRYDQPLSGLYWQVTTGTTVLERSRSLWDETLALPSDAPSTGLHEHVIPGPNGRPLVAVERTVRVERSAHQAPVRFVVAQDRADTIAAIASFNREIMLMLLVLGTLLLLAYGVSVSVGLQPLTRLRNDLADLHHGGIRRLGGHYPSEVALLVDDLNKLLDARDRVAERNRRRAADLAHGLKTPITAISTIAEELRDAGQSDTGKELTDYVATMQRHVERELALARSNHGTHSVAPTLVQPLVAAIVRSLERLPRGQEIAWTIDIPASLVVPIEPTALAEVIGGLLDNARKWAHGRVVVQSRESGGRVHLSVTDDGPGVAPDQLASLASRGFRLDQKHPGSGLGLAIATEIMSELGGSIRFANASAGGFVASVELPLVNGADMATACTVPSDRTR